MWYTRSMSSVFDLLILMLILLENQGARSITPFFWGGVIPALLEVLSGFRYIQRKTQRWIAGVAKPSQPLQFKIWYKIWCFDCFATPTCDPQHSKRALGNIFKDCKSTKRFDIHYTSNEKTTKWGLYDTEGSRL